MPSDAKQIDPLDLADSFQIFDDFTDYNSGDLWTSLAADTGSSVAASDAHGGVLVLTCGDDDNEEAAVATTKACYLLEANKPAVMRGRIQFTDADALAANVACGLSSIFTADFITDNGGGIAASFSGAVFFKKDQDTYWSVCSSNGTTQTITRTNVVAASASYQDLEVRITPYSSANAEVTFHHNGQQVRDANGELIKHVLAIASIAAMKLGAYVKEGGGTNQLLKIDYLAVRAKR